MKVFEILKLYDFFRKENYFIFIIFLIIVFMEAAAEFRELVEYL